jgi:hypothetical protein
VCRYGTPQNMNIKIFKRPLQAPASEDMLIAVMENSRLNLLLDNLLPEGGHLFTLHREVDGQTIDILEITARRLPPPPPIYEIDYDPSSEKDQTLHILGQLNAIPNSEDPNNPNIIRFSKGGRVKAEGDRLNDPKGKNGVFSLRNKKGWHITTDPKNPVSFYTTAPAVPYGGNVNKGNYSHRRTWWFHQCENLRVSNIRVEGSNYTEGPLLGSSQEHTPGFWPLGKSNPKDTDGFPAYVPYWELEHAFDLRGCKNVVLENLSTFGTWGDGVYIGGKPASENIRILNCHLKWAGRQGIAMANHCRNILIDGVRIDNAKRSAIDMEPHTSDGIVQGVEIRNSALFGFLNAVAAGGRGDVSDVYIHDNTYRGTTLRCYGKENLRRKNWRWINNRRETGWYSSPLGAAIFSYVDNVQYEGNYDPITETQSRIGVELNNCEGEMIVARNNFVNPSRIVTRNTDRSKVLVEGNTPIFNELGPIVPQEPLDLSGYTPVYLINVGSTSAYTATNGSVYGADRFVKGGSVGRKTGINIANASEDALYLQFRQGEMQYKLQGLQNGNYLLVLHFSEHYHTGPYLRTFHIKVQGERWATDYDIWGKVGASHNLVREAIPVRVERGQLLLELTTGLSDQPLLNAIELYKK